jgi:hypothetical protein
MDIRSQRSKLFAPQEDDGPAESVVSTKVDLKNKALEGKAPLHETEKPSILSSSSRKPYHETRKNAPNAGANLVMRSERRVSAR